MSCWGLGVDRRGGDATAQESSMLLTVVVTVAGRGLQDLPGPCGHGTSSEAHNPFFDTFPTGP